MKPRTITFTLLIISTLLIGILFGIFLSHQMMISTQKNNSSQLEKKPLYWIDAMEPQIHYSAPGKSHMGMELIPVYPDNQQTNTNQNIIHISPNVVNNLGVRTTPVIKGSLPKQIETVGYIEPNENKITHIHTYADGWIRNLVVKAAGEPVKKGQLILQLYSPMLVNAEEEYLIAMESKNLQLINASYKRLLALGFSEQQIQQLQQTRKSSLLVDIYAPQNGIIANLNVREGMRVTPETEIMSIEDLSSVWMLIQVYENQSSWVKVGQFAEAKFSAFPGKIWKGAVEYVYPQLDPTTRTLKVRIRFDNPKGLLKPNMYADVTLFAEAKPNVLSIPTQALIRSSKGDYVIVSLGDGQFEIRAITTGIESGDRVEILSGLKEGENVVISGQFLIDSEANLKASFQRIEKTAAPGKTTP